MTVTYQADLTHLLRPLARTRILSITRCPHELPPSDFHTPIGSSEAPVVILKGDKRPTWRSQYQKEVLLLCYGVFSAMRRKNTPPIQYPATQTLL